MTTAVSRFLGIIISMHFNEHNPPHFHAEYNEHKAALAIKTQDHQEELLANWNSISDTGEYRKINPLV